MVRVEGTYRCEDNITHAKQFNTADGNCPSSAVINGKACALVPGTCMIISGNICFIATAAYGSELAPPVQFLREFRDEIVLKSRFKKTFEVILDVYYRFSPPIASEMRRNKPFKYAMKYFVVWPFVAASMVCAYLIEIITKKEKVKT